VQAQIVPEKLPRNNLRRGRLLYLYFRCPSPRLTAAGSGQVVISGEDANPTLSEVALMPGDDALFGALRGFPGERTTPTWRTSAITDVLPVQDDDPRLVPGYVDSGGRRTR